MGCWVCCLSSLCLRKKGKPWPLTDPKLAASFKSACSALDLFPLTDFGKFRHSCRMGFCSWVDLGWGCLDRGYSIVISSSGLSCSEQRRSSSGLVDKGSACFIHIYELSVLSISCLLMAVVFLSTPISLFFCLTEFSPFATSFISVDKV